MEFAHFICYAFTLWKFLTGFDSLVVILFVVWMYLENYTFLQTLHECERFLNQQDRTVRKDNIPPDTLSIINKLHEVFLTSMSDDLHTPVVLAGLSDPLKSINDLLHTRKVWYLLRCIGMGMYLLI